MDSAYQRRTETSNCWQKTSLWLSAVAGALTCLSATAWFLTFLVWLVTSIGGAVKHQNLIDRVSAEGFQDRKAEGAENDNAYFVYYFTIWIFCTIVFGLLWNALGIGWFAHRD